MITMPVSDLSWYIFGRFTSNSGYPIVSTTTDIGGNDTLSLPSLRLAPLKASGLMVSGASNVL
jgi:hypothetical protein